MSEVTHVGIDPGVAKGAIAWLIDGELRIKPLPNVKYGKGGYRYDRPKLLALFRAIPKPLNVMLEEPQFRRHEAWKSIATNNRGFGHIEMALTAAGLLNSDIEVVTCEHWQHLMHMGYQQYPNPKDRSFMACQKLFPGVSLMRSSRATKPDDGFADAALLALYAKRIYTGEA